MDCPSSGNIRIFRMPSLYWDWQAMASPSPFRGWSLSSKSLPVRITHYYIIIVSTGEQALLKDFLIFEIGFQVQIGCEMNRLKPQLKCRFNIGSIVVDKQR